MSFAKNRSQKAPTVREGDVISVVTEKELKLGICVQNGSVVYAKVLRVDSCVRKVVRESLDNFSEGEAVSVENYYTGKSCFNGFMRAERANSLCGRFWGNKHDADPGESFVRYVCEGINPPDGTSAYKFTLTGAAIGFYMGGGLIGAAIGSGIGLMMDSAR
jgi:hypothetical protein